MSDPLPWSELYAARRAAAARWPSVFGLRVEKTPGRVVAAECAPGATVLDVGAGTGALREALARHAPGARYLGLDPDAATRQDFRRLEEVTERVDVAAVLEVIEHLTLDDGLALLRAVRERVRPGGACVVSTPAIQTPGRFLRDATHRTPYAHDELAGLCTLAGFTVERLVRTWNAPALARAFRLWIAAPLHRYLGVDFAHSVCAVARRAGGGPAPERPKAAAGVEPAERAGRSGPGRRAGAGVAPEAAPSGGGERSGPPPAAV